MKPGKDVFVGALSKVSFGEMVDGLLHHGYVQNFAGVLVLNKKTGVAISSMNYKTMVPDQYGFTIPEFLEILERVRDIRISRYPDQEAFFCRKFEEFRQAVQPEDG